MPRHIADSEQIIEGHFALSVGPSSMPAPPGWQWVKLTDVARLETGHTPSRTHPEYWDGNIHWIGIRDARLHHGGVIMETAQTVTQEGLDNSAARLLPAGTVCLSRTASVGYVVVMGRPMATSQDFVNWVCSDALAPRFLQMLLLAEHTSLLRFGKGSTHTTIYFPEVQAFHICLPPLAEQHRIISSLDSLRARNHSAKEALDAIPALLERFRQSVLAAAFRGDLTADWRAQHPDVEPASKLLERIRAERRRRWEETELEKMRVKGKIPKNEAWKAAYAEPATPEPAQLPKLPDNWCWASFEEISINFDGDRIPVKLEDRRNQQGKYPYYGASGAIDSVNDYLFDGEYLLIAEDGANLLSRSTPIAFPASGRFWVNNHAHVIQTPSKAVPLAYLESYINSIDLQPFITGTAQPKLTQKNLNKIPIALAPADEQKEILRLISTSMVALENSTDAYKKAHTQISRLNSAIITKAFRGELVPQDPNDEPASVLLERIRAEREATAGSAPKRSRGRSSAA